MKLSKEMIILISLLVALVFICIYVFAFWGKWNDNYKRSLEKKYGVKFKYSDFFIMPGSWDHMYSSQEIKGRVSPGIKRWVDFQYWTFVFLTVGGPFIIWMLIFFYFMDELRPLLNTRF